VAGLLWQVLQTPQQLVLSAGILLAQTTTNPAIAYVYVGELTSVAAFRVLLDGSTHTVSGSPFTIGAFAMTASPNYVFTTGGKVIKDVPKKL
jgi:hypothetical protein